MSTYAVTAASGAADLPLMKDSSRISLCWARSATGTEDGQAARRVLERVEAAGALLRPLLLVGGGGGGESGLSRIGAGAGLNILAQKAS
jgi:hypothetical protein